MGNVEERDCLNTKTKTICVDFDGCLAMYDKWEGALVLGDPLPGAREFMKALKEEGFEVLLYTCRASGEFEFPRWGYPGEGTGKHLASQQMVEAALWAWGDRHDIPFDRIWTGRYKPHADAYVDDRGVSCAPEKSGSMVYAAAFLEVLRLAKRDAKTALHKSRQLAEKLLHLRGRIPGQCLPTNRPSNVVGDGEWR